MTEEYIPYGEDWEKEMMKLPKKFLIEQLKNKWQQSQQPEEADGWISVEDRLPEKRKDSVWSTLVLIYGDEEYDTAAYRKDVKCWSEDIIHVTHWQPLPLPPKK